MRIDECKLTADGSHYRGIAVEPASGSKLQFLALSNGQIVLTFQQTEVRANSSVVWCRLEHRQHCNTRLGRGSQIEPNGGLKSPAALPAARFVVSNLRYRATEKPPHFNATSNS